MLSNLSGMAANDHTEMTADAVIESLSRDADLLANREEMTAETIEAGIRRTLAKHRGEFTELFARAKGLPFGHPDRREFARQARILGRMIADCHSILTRRHWQEFDEAADLTTVKRRGRPSKAMIAAREAARQAAREAKGGEG